MNSSREVFLSVDIEASGAIPGEYALLSIGACDAYDTTQTFDCRLKPTTRNADPKALAVTGLSLDELERSGLTATSAMEAFRDWIAQRCTEGAVPVFVGFNAAFDWSFINYYFHRYLGHNPFGFAALDIKSLYMGSARTSWADTKSSRISAVLNPALRGNHDALHDALYQAELFRLIREL